MQPGMVARGRGGSGKWSIVMFDVGDCVVAGRGSYIMKLGST